MALKNKAWRTALLIAAIAIGLGTAAEWTVHTKAFGRFALAKVIDWAQNSVGTRVEIGSMAIHWNRLRVDFYNFAVYGSQGTSQPPLLQGTHLGVGLKILSLFKRTVELEEIDLDRPVFDLRVDSQGRSNLPPSRSGHDSSASPDFLFDMAIGHVAIRSGEILYRDQEIPLGVDLHDFHAQTSYSMLARNYTGSVGYSDGHIVTRNFSPINHSAQLHFTADRSTLTVDPLTVMAGRSRFSLRVKLSDYSRPDIQAEYGAILDAREMGDILKRSEFPDGQLGLAGTLRYQYSSRQSFLESVYVDGNLRSSGLSLRTGQISAKLSSLHGLYRLQDGNFHLSDLEADLLQGHFSASAEIRNLGGPVSSRITAALRGISLAAVTDTLPPGNYRRLRIAGRANVDAQASWSNSIEKLQGHARISITAPNEKTATKSEIPINGVLDIGYDGVHATASFGQSHIRTGNTEILLHGTVSKRSALNVEVNASDLGEASSLASLIETASQKSPSRSAERPLDLHGSARFTGQLFGSPENPTLQGQLFASNLEVKGSRWRSMRAGIDLSDSHVALQNGSLINSQQGQLTLSGRASLDHWSFTPASPLSLQMAATNLSAADLEHLGQISYPVTGVLTASVSLQGSEQHPSGHGTVRLVKASAWNQPIDDLDIRFENAGPSIHSTVEVQMPAGKIAADLDYSLDTQQYDLGLQAPAIRIDRLEAVERHEAGIAGSLAASITGRGTLRNPQLSASVQVSHLQVRNQSIPLLQVQLSVAQQRANFTLNGTVAQGAVQAKGEVALSGAYPVNSSIDVHALPLGPLLSAYLPGSQADLQGQMEIHGTLSGPLKDPSRLEGHLEVPSLNLAYQSAQIALSRPLIVDCRNGVATLQPTELKGTDTDLKIQGVLPFGNPAALSAAVDGSMNLSLLQNMIAGVKSSGRVDLHVSTKGGSTRPGMQGSVHIVNAAFLSQSVPVGLESVNAEIDISGTRFDVRQFGGMVGGGTVSAQGSLTYGSQPSFDLSLQAKSVRVRYPQGLRSILNANLQLGGTPGSSLLSGEMVVNRMSFTQDFDLADFMGQFNAESPSSGSPWEQNMRLKVSLRSDQDLNLINSKLSLGGAANLNVTGTLANPVILGRVTLTSGDIFFLSNRYQVQSGVLEFSNPVRTDPTVNIYATTTVEQYNITINFVGSMDRLRTNYTSDPSLPPSDIINLIAFGKTAEESATAPSTPATVGAESVLAQGVTSQVSGKIQQLAGISQLSVDPLVGSDQQNAGAQVAIQQRVTGNILLTFTTDTTQTQATTVQVQYRTSSQTTVSVLRDQNGGYAIDVRYHKAF